MIGISSYDSSSISTLFSSLNNSSGSGGTDLLGINYSDYASIKSGAYGKLMRSYYSLDSKDSSAKTDSKNSKSTAVSSDSAKTLANIEENASGLLESAKTLYSRKNNEVFATDSKGNYDTDKIYEKVSDFVEDYNSLLSAAAKSDTTRITNGVDTLQSLTKTNESALKDMGISIDEKTGTLSINADTFKSSDMSKVKNLFYGTGSYAYGVATQASMVDSYAQAEASKSNTYGSTGKYNYNYNSGSIFYDGF